MCFGGCCASYFVGLVCPNLSVRFSGSLWKMFSICFFSFLGYFVFWMASHARLICSWLSIAIACATLGMSRKKLPA